MEDKFIKQMLEIGVLSFKEQETLFNIAQRCAKTSGIPMAGAGALMGMKAGTVVVPGIGTISGTVAGALAGLVGGTVSCTALNYSMKEELKKLAKGQ